MVPSPISTTLLPLSGLGKLHNCPEPRRVRGESRERRDFKKCWGDCGPTRQGLAVLLLVKECLTFADHHVAR